MAKPLKIREKMEESTQRKAPPSGTRRIGETSAAGDRRPDSTDHLRLRKIEVLRVD
jgi:hypothetical protein